MARPNKVVGSSGIARARNACAAKSARSIALAAILAFPPVSEAAAFYLGEEQPFGYSWYDLESNAPDSAYTGSGQPMIRSQLDFPLDPFRLSLGWTSADGSGTKSTGALVVSAETWISMGPAFLSMRDQDWVGESATSGVSTSTVLVKFSDTYSRAESILFGGEASDELSAWSLLGEPFAIGLGAGGSRYVYKIYGLEGKRLSDSEGHWISNSLPDDLLVGTYATWSLHGVLSLRSQARMLGLDWKARILPLSYTESVDDHILRKKRIEMTCWGTGGSLEAGRLSAGAHWMPYARFELERTWGRMRQTYYADSPDSPANETGQSYGGIHTTVNTWLIALGLRMFWR